MLDAATRSFLETVYACYGYDLRDYAPASMGRRVRAALARSGLSDLAALEARVLADPECFTAVLDDLTVRVSDMFRDPPLHLALREQVVPLLRTYPALNIWHCGCATGEEVYSLAILLAETGLHERARIYATDLSSHALEQAKEGVYPAQHLPRYADNYRRAGGTRDFRDHATIAYDQVALRGSLRRSVVFFQHDLVSDHVFGEMQVIFCRNVLLYFGPELRQRALAKLAASLAPGGFLILGADERPPTLGSWGEPASAFADFEPTLRIFRRGAGLSVPRPGPAILSPGKANAA